MSVRAKSFVCAAFRLSVVLISVVITGACRHADAPDAASLRFISAQEAAALPDLERAGFDIDDTLLFSTPAFDVGQAS
ncbi:MAG: hypothetical protein AAGI67_18980, partial [Pseudomonadota bacterium]